MSEPALTGSNQHIHKKHVEAEPVRRRRPVGVSNQNSDIAHQAHTERSKNAHHPAGSVDAHAKSAGLTIDNVFVAATMPGDMLLAKVGGTKITTTQATTVTISVTARTLRVRFQPGLQVDPGGGFLGYKALGANARVNEISFTFSTGAFASDVTSEGGGVDATDEVREALVENISKAIRGTSLAQPNYNPFADPNLLDTLQGIGTNVSGGEKVDKKKKKKRKKGGVDASDFGELEAGVAVRPLKALSYTEGDHGVSVKAGGKLTLKITSGATIEDLVPPENADAEWAQQQFRAHLEGITLGGAVAISHKGRPLAIVRDIQLLAGGFVKVNPSNVLPRSGAQELFGTTNRTQLKAKVAHAIETEAAAAVRQIVLNNRNAVPQVDLAKVLGIE